jgi:hypothetical protein
MLGSSTWTTLRKAEISASSWRHILLISDLEMPLHPERGHQVVDLPGRHAMHVVDPPTPFQQGGEECALPELLDRQFEIPALVHSVRGW